MTDFEAIRKEQEAKLKKALFHLKYTHEKVQSLPSDCSAMDEEQLETWESYSARFSRVADIFLTRYLRTRILEHDPGFSGTLRDFLHTAEKIGLVEDTKEWLAIRELRNLAAHEYVEEGLTRFFKLIKEKAPMLLAIQELLEK